MDSQRQQVFASVTTSVEAGGATEIVVVGLGASTGLVEEGLGDSTDLVVVGLGAAGVVIAAAEVVGIGATIELLTGATIGLLEEAGTAELLKGTTGVETATLVELLGTTTTGALEVVGTAALVEVTTGAADELAGAEPAARETTAGPGMMYDEAGDP